MRSEGWREAPGEGVGEGAASRTAARSVSSAFACAVATIATLFLRRAALGFELGGPAVWANVTAVFFVLLWFVYLALSILREL